MKFRGNRFGGRSPGGRENNNGRGFVNFRAPQQNQINNSNHINRRGHEIFILDYPHGSNPNIGVLVNAVQQSVFNTIVHIYSNVINLDKLSIYTDEHPRSFYRYETLLVIKNFLLTTGVINENNFSNAIMLNLLNKYHDENFATIQEYENYF